MNEFKLKQLTLEDRGCVSFNSLFVHPLILPVKALEIFGSLRLFRSFVEFKFILASKIELNVTIHHMEHETIHATE